MVPETAGIKRFGTRIISLILVIGILLSFATPAFASVTSETVWVLDSQKPTWLKDSDITGNKWTYTKKTDKNSTDSTMSGYTLASSSWIQKATGSVNYASFPSGFDTTNSIYTSFKNTSTCPYTASETTTNKRTVTTKDSGYVYWHWMYDCGGASGTSTRAIYNKKGTASKDSGGTGFYYKYFGAFTSTEGNYDSSTGYCNSLGIRNYIVTGRSSYAQCQGATRWFRFAYKTATYTDYYKRFTFTKTENLESSTAVTAGTTTSGSDDTLTKTTISNVKHYISYVLPTDKLAEPSWSAPQDSYMEINDNEIKVLPGTEISLSCISIGAEIKYMLDYDTIAGYKVYSAPIPVGNDLTLYYYSTRSGENSQVKKLTVTVVDALAEPPKISTLPAQEISDTTAVLSAAVIADGDYDLSFTYWTKGGKQIRVIDRSGSDCVTVSGLMPDTEYYFRATAVNEGGTVPGGLSTFRTSKTNAYVNRTIELQPYVSIRQGRTVTLFPSVYPGGDSEGLVWSSDDSNVATVTSDGEVIAVGTGTTRVRATLARERVSAVCVVEVVSEGNANISYTENLDFSELNMITNSSVYASEQYGFDTGWNDGGNALMATAYLARWDGAVSESNDRYPSSGSATDIVFAEKESEYHIQNVMFLPYRSDRNDNSEIKRAIVKYGAVYSAFVYNERYYYSKKAQYYMPESAKASGGQNHAIVIVGWDDDYIFDKDKYYNGNKQTANNNKGAFICKNSWGEDWGENGYFYISYDDAYLGREGCNDYNAVFLAAESCENYDKIYQHDYLGPVATGTAKSSEAYLCNVFPGGSKKLASDEDLRAVSFYVYAPSTPYRVYVVPDYSGPSSLSDAVFDTPAADGVADYAGYMTVNLPSPVSLSAGSSFAVIVVLESIDGEVNYFVEAPKTGYSSKAKASAGESFISLDGEIWSDYQVILKNANLCIKAFTDVSTSMMSVAQSEEMTEDNESEHIVYSAAELISMGYETTEEMAKLFSADDSESYGQITPSVFFDGSSPNISGVNIFKKSYSLRSDKYVSDVRNQGNIGSCWAFASLASLESCTIKAAAETRSLKNGLSQAGIVDKIELSPSSDVILPVGGSRQIIATVLPLGSTENINWSSSDSSIASVSPSGIVTAHKVGYCVIYAKTENSDRSASIRITVMPAARLAELIITNTKVTYKAGELFLVDYSVSPANAVVSGVVFGSSDETIATVDEYGLVTALRQGTVTIFVSHEDPESGEVITGEKVITITDEAMFSANIEENGLVISEAGALSGNLMVSLEGASGTEESSILVAGFYCGGKFLHMEILGASFEGMTKEDYTFDITGLNLTDISDADAIEVRVFAVESLETMIPVSGVDSCFVAIPNKEAEATE